LFSVDKAAGMCNKKLEITFYLTQIALLSGKGGNLELKLKGLKI